MQGPLLTRTSTLQTLAKIFYGMLRTSKTAPWNACKIVIEGPSRELRRSLDQDLRNSTRSSTHRATMRAIRHAQSHSCASHVKVRTAPQRERSDTHKVTRWLRVSATCVEVYKVLRLPRKMSPRQTATTVLCEPGQSKCTWTSHKGTFIREFTII